MVRAGVIVLGCRALNDQPTALMRHRVELGVKVYKDLRSTEGEAPFLVLTGYMGAGQTLSEAAVMEKIALEMEVPKVDILIEDQATCTVENAYFSKLLLDEAEVVQIHVVSSDFHIPRVEVIFGQLYPSPAYTVAFHGAPEELTEGRKGWEDRELARIDKSLHYFTHLYGSKAIPHTFHSPVIPDGFFHGFTCRLGGVSRYKTLSSLNLHFNPNRKDPRVFVEQNQARVAKRLGFDISGFRKASCVHGNTVWVVGSEPRPTDGYDGLVTDQRGIVLAAPGADCLPVIFCDPVKKICGACHSGWKGTVAKVAVCVVQIMKERFGCRPEDVRAAVGPSIGACCFEVGEDLAEQFDDEFVIRNPDWKKPHVDLWGSVYADLISFGLLPENMDMPKPWKETSGTRSVNRNTTVTQCTACDPEDRFFSHRRHGIQFGTQCGIIGVK
eukprot:m.233715 g.233715  ORF g.233715 m.233715 type:complete len:441 (+) comp40097_c1_seq4:1156-2478(+)